MAAETSQAGAPVGFPGRQAQRRSVESGCGSTGTAGSWARRLVHVSVEPMAAVHSEVAFVGCLAAPSVLNTPAVDAAAGVNGHGGAAPQTARCSIDGVPGDGVRREGAVHAAGRIGVQRSNAQESRSFTPAPCFRRRVVPASRRPGLLRRSRRRHRLFSARSARPWRNPAG